jgi:hypothetical protein
MQNHTLAHAYQVDSFLAVIDPFDRKRIAERLDRVMERDAMGLELGCDICHL